MQLILGAANGTYLSFHVHFCILNSCRCLIKIKHVLDNLYVCMNTKLFWKKYDLKFGHVEKIIEWGGGVSRNKIGMSL